MQPAQSRGIRKGIRDMIQSLVAVAAAGGATAVIELIVDSVSPAYGILLAFVFKVLIAYAQNYLEAKGSIPTLLPTPGLITKEVGGLTGKTVGTVDTVVDNTTGAATQVVGQVLDTAGNTVGGVLGTATGLLGGADKKGE